MLSELVVNELEELKQEHAGFKVTDLDSANWAFRKLSVLKQQRQEFMDLADKEIGRIHHWLQTELDKLSNQENFFNGLLTEYATVQRAANPKFKVSTPYGKVSFRKAPAKWNYDDETVLKSLKASNMTEFIRVKEEVNKADLKKITQVNNGKVIIAETGELIEGIEVVEQPETMKIEVE